MITIYKGKDEDTAIIPLSFHLQNDKQNIDWAKKIIENDANAYKSNITDNKIKKQVDSAINHIEFKTPSVTANEYTISNDNNLKSSLLESEIDLYYIENFTYVLDDDSYTDYSTSNEIQRENNDYMFTIIPVKIDVEVKNE